MPDNYLGNFSFFFVSRCGQHCKILFIMQHLTFTFFLTRLKASDQRQEFASSDFLSCPQEWGKDLRRGCMYLPFLIHNEESYRASLPSPVMKKTSWTFPSNGQRRAQCPSPSPLQHIHTFYLWCIGLQLRFTFSKCSNDLSFFKKMIGGTWKRSLLSQPCSLFQL